MTRAQHMAAQALLTAIRAYGVSNVATQDGRIAGRATDADGIAFILECGRQGVFNDS
jgi:hypothetical protein